MDCETIWTTAIGVIGTLLGTVLGWFLNNLSRWGQLRVFVTKWDEHFKYNKIGKMEESPSFDLAEYYSYKLYLDVYNDSADAMIMRNIRVEFVSHNKAVASGRPLDESTRQSTNLLPRYEEIEVLNIPPKTVVSLHLHGDFCRSGSKDLERINTATKVRLAYVDRKGVDRFVEIDSSAAITRFEGIAIKAARIDSPGHAN